MFKIGDLVVLSEKGIEFFSKNNWHDFPIPHLLATGHVGTVEFVELLPSKELEKRVYVRLESQKNVDNTFFHESDLKLYKGEEIKSTKEKKHSHYFKECPYEYIDVYRVLDLFEVVDPCIQHCVKKLLVAGGRKHKDIDTDIQDVIDTLERWKEMQKEYRNTH